MSVLPQGWATVKVEEVAEINPKNSLHDETEIGFVPMSLLPTRHGQGFRSEKKKWAEVKKGYTHFKNGDVLLAKITPCFENGKSGIADRLENGAGAGSTEFIVFRPYAGLMLPQLLLALFRTEEFLKVGAVNMTGSVGQKRVPKDFVGAYAIGLPPFNEQTRIANKLDQTLAIVERARARLDRVPGILKRFRQSVLAAATDGRLTEDWRDNKPEQTIAPEPCCAGLWEIPISWQWQRAETVCGFITKGTTPSKDKMSVGDGDIPYIKVYNLTFDGTLDFSIEPTFVGAKTHTIELKRSIALPGDVLMNIVGPPLGKISIVPNTYPEWNINQAIARFRAQRELDSKYLAYCLMNERTIAHASMQSKATAGQFNLTLEICRQIPLPIPPVAEQQEIIRRVETLFALADRIEARYQAAAARVDKLTQALLAKAFRGELVPQDPNDEPAEHLLARIRAARAEAPAPRGRGRKAAQSGS